MQRPEEISKSYITKSKILQNSGFSTVEQKRRPGKFAFLACLFMYLKPSNCDYILGFWHVCGEINTLFGENDPVKRWQKFL